MGAIVFLLLILGLSWWFYRSARKRKQRITAMIMLWIVSVIVGVLLSRIVYVFVLTLLGDSVTSSQWMYSMTNVFTIILVYVFLKALEKPSKGDSKGPIDSEFIDNK